MDFRIQWLWMSGSKNRFRWWDSEPGGRNVPDGSYDAVRGRSRNLCATRGRSERDTPATMR
jgi:hypothetical protein